MSESIAVLCAGAAKGLALALEPAFAAATGAGIEATFGAVGALHEKLIAGAPCDVVVLTAALVGTLEKEGQLVPRSAVPLGSVRTGIAVRTGEPLPDIRDAASLRATLTGASRLLFPDPQRATAGIHFVDVLRRLGIHDEVASRFAQGKGVPKDFAAAAEWYQRAASRGSAPAQYRLGGARHAGWAA